jgi:hypothetical protein
MSIVRASRLSISDLRLLGNNLVGTVRHDRRHSIGAINRSLAIHDESIERLNSHDRRSRSIRRASAA